jgi:hypothetical protein
VARRRAQQVTNLLVRRRLTDRDVEGLADLLSMFLSRHGIRVLRRRLRVHADPTDKDRQANAASWRALHLRERDVWLAEHPGRKAKDYWDNLDGEVLEWRSAGNMASLEPERQAWLADHPGEEHPEHECGLSGREYTDLARWRRQRERRLVRSTTTLRGRGGGGPGV